jgi:hypothetical protein
MSHFLLFVCGRVRAEIGVNRSPHRLLADFISSGGLM